VYGSRKEKPRLYTYTQLINWVFNRNGECLLRGTNWILKYNLDES